MPGKKISDLDVYDDVNTDKSRRDLFEVSKNTGTYASPTYATDGSRKITIEQLKETLFIKDINSYNQVTTGSPTFVKQSYNGIANAGTYTLPISVGSYEVLAIILESEINVTVNGLGSGISDLFFTKQNETALLIDTTYGWYPLAINKEVNSSAFELLANKENTTLDNSSTKYPTNNLVKTYVDNLGNTLTSGLATKLTIANNLSDLTNTIQARDNLFLGATNDVTHNSITLSNTTVSTLPFINNAKKIISATGALLGTWFQTLTADSNPVDADTIIVNDSANSFEAKKTTLLQFWTNYLLAKVQALGYLTGSGLTTNRLTKWNGSTLIDSIFTENGNLVGNSGYSILNSGSSGGVIYIGNSASAFVKLECTNFVQLKGTNGTEVEGLFIVRNTLGGANRFLFNGTTSNMIAYDTSNAVFATLNPNGLALGVNTINSATQIDLQSTTKGLGLNLVANGSKPTGRKGNFLMNNTNSVLEFTTGTGANWQELAVYKFDELLQITDCNATFATANTGVYFPFVPKCDINVTKIFYNLQSAGTDTVRVAIYSDSSNTPTTLLVQSSESTTGATTIGQRSITIASTRLLAQTIYWIAIKNDNGASSFLSKNNVYSNNITREGFTSGAFVGSPAPSSSVNAVWVGLGI